MRSLLTALILTAALVAAHAAETPRDAAAELARAKVVVLKSRQPQRFGRRGSAMAFMAAPGLALTAAHAMHPDRETTAWLNGAAYSTRALAMNRSLDVAVIRIGAGRLLLKPIPLAADSHTLALGEQLLIVTGPAQGTNAHGEPSRRRLLPAIYRGRRLQKTVTGKREYHLYLGAQVIPGDSGSPVVRVRDGKVVGILVSRTLPDDGGPSMTAYAAPIEWAFPLLKKARKSARQATPDSEFYLLQPAAGR